MAERTQAGSAVYWLAVLCKPRREAEAVEHLQRQGFTVFLPEIRRPPTPRGRKGNEPLFPRYVFLQVNEAEGDLRSVRSTRGVVDWLRLNGELRSAPEILMAAIREVAVTDATEDQARLTSLAPGMAARAEDVAALLDPNPQQRVWALLDRLAQGPVR